jgi:hypothetical protein
MRTWPQGKPFCSPSQFSCRGMGQSIYYILKT